MSREESADAHRDRYLVFQPDLAAGAWKLWGQVPAADGEAIWNALRARESDLPALPDQTSGQRLVDALTSICLDSLAAPPPDADPGPKAGERAVVYGGEVFIDAATAAATFGEAGATFTSGLKAGPNLLDELLCCGRVRLIGLQDGTPIVVTNRQQPISYLCGGAGDGRRVSHWPNPSSSMRLNSDRKSSGGRQPDKL